MIADPIVEFSLFSFRYESRKEATLEDISLTIKSGEKILIAGPSGSGKTTIGNCLNGLIPHSFKGVGSGRLKVAGFEPASTDLHELSKSVGTVLQDTDGQFVGLSVGEDIAFALENDARPRDEMHTAVSRAASLVEMGEYLNRSPFALSGGQKQRVSLAGILIDDVDLLLFDEPLANLDPATGKLAIELIDQLHRETGKTIIIIEHRLEDVLHRPIDRIILIDRGKVIADESPDSMLTDGTLATHGIREPLYLSALRLAGGSLRVEDHPASLDSLDLDRHRDNLVSWFDSRPMVAERPHQPKLLTVKGISYSYDGELTTLDKVGFSIESGERISLLGENGAGKSTLAKIIMGLIKPDEGNLSWSGNVITGENISERSRKIGFVMQNPNHMISQHLIRDEVAFGPRLRGVCEADVTERVESTLRTCGLYPFRNWPISALSYGQKKRVTIAAILIMEPQLLIMDEPTAGQDYFHYTEFMEFITKLNRESGLTILLVTHDLHLALEYTERSLVLSHGYLIADDSVPKIFADSELLTRASLKPTSLYGLARKLNIEAVDEFIAHFISSEGAVRSG